MGCFSKISWQNLKPVNTAADVTPAGIEKNVKE